MATNVEILDLTIVGILDLVWLVLSRTTLSIFCAKVNF